LGTPWALAWGAVQLVVTAADRAIYRGVRLRAGAGQAPDLRWLGPWAFFVGAVSASFAVVIWQAEPQRGDMIAAVFLAVVSLSSVISLRASGVLVLAALAPASALAVVATSALVRQNGHHQTDYLPLIGAAFFTALAFTIWKRMRDADLATEAALADLAKARARAEAASQAKTRFLKGMSNGLRTPMTAVLGSAELLRRTELSSDARAHVEAVLDAGDVLVAALNDILDIAKVEAGQVQIVAAAADPRVLARSVVGAWKSRAEAKWLELFLDIEAGVPEAVMIDSVRVKQLLYNLISNAVKFTDHGGVRLVVSAKAISDVAMELRFSVIDTGRGLNEETLASALQGGPKPGAEPGDALSSAGFGLSVCATLAKLMGGRLDVETSPGAGSAFTFVLPALIASAEAIAQQEALPAADGLKLKILVAEDHAVSRKIIGALLQQFGAEAAFAADGREALDLLTETRFDAVLMDLQMPELSGISVMRALKAKPGPNQDTPVIALTAAAMPEDRELCFAAGMVGHVSKPIDPRRLFSELAQVCAGLSRNAA
jgi:hypothetical protein